MNEGQPEPAQSDMATASPMASPSEGQPGLDHQRMAKMRREQGRKGDECPPAWPARLTKAWQSGGLSHPCCDGRGGTGKHGRVSAALSREG